MARALYRTYRSKSFDEVVGQSHVTELLKNAISSGKIAHAYLLTGPRGTGKTSIARIIAHEVNGLEYTEDQNLDIIEIDAASNRRIDDIRELREKVHIAPVSAKYKVYIIDEVHMLTGESFNALLKTLEEPPEHAIFILATTEVHKLPATVISRTQRYHLHPATVTDLVKHLSAIAKKESIDITDEALELVAGHANGGFRDAVSLLDQLSGPKEKITAESVEQALGMAPKAAIDSIVVALQAHEPKTVFDQLESLENNGVSSLTIVDQLNSSLLSAAASNPNLFTIIDALIEVPRSYNPRLKLIAALVKAATPETSSKTVAAAVHKPSASFTMEVPKKSTAKKQEASEEKPSEATVEPVVSTPVEAISSVKPSDGTFEWDKVLVVIKKHYPGLSSVLGRAKYQFDPAKSELLLNFEYVIHRKKIDNQVSRKQLFAVIKDVCGVEATIVTTDSKSTPPAALNETEQDIAAIMGGGELVNGSF